jgi:CBS domain containing-hemolysin-like protein
VQAMVEIPYILVQSTVYALITYSMINFQWTAGISNWSKAVLCILFGLAAQVYEHFLMCRIMPTFLCSYIALLNSVFLQKKCHKIHA